jgi:hypothetical protein
LTEREGSITQSKVAAEASVADSTTATVNRHPIDRPNRRRFVQCPRQEKKVSVVVEFKALPPQPGLK